MITSGTDFGSDCSPENYRLVDPIELARQWLPDADAPPALMALATTGVDGFPRVRHVLLTEIADGSIYFHTDTRSAKTEELAADPRAAITVAWPAVGRQLSMHGTVTRADSDEERSAYRHRSRYLKLLAWLNDAQSAAMPVNERRRRWADFDRDHPEPVAPDTWVGFALRPVSVTFWRGDPDGPSQRTRFTSTDHGWDTEILPG